MKLRNEPVLTASTIAGAIVAASSALLALDDGQTIYRAAGEGLAYLAIVLGGGSAARMKSYGPETVDEVMDAEAVIAQAERGDG